MDYSLDVPLQFSNDLLLNIGSTVDNPVKDVSAFENQDNMTVSLTLSVKNRIPLALKIRLTALDIDSMPLFTVESDNIKAATPIDPATGFATNATLTNTHITLTTQQINQLKNTEEFRLSFVVTSNQQYRFVTIQPSDYIEIKVGAQVSGGVQLDLKND
jgi:membrane-associated protease RseP (regulator of RpoE activity)